METSENKLDNLFKKAAKQEPLLTVHEVESLLKSIPDTQPKRRNTRFGIAGLIIVLVAGITILFLTKGNFSIRTKAANPVILAGYGMHSDQMAARLNNKVILKKPVQAFNKEKFTKNDALATPDPVTPNRFHQVKPLIVNDLVMRDVNGKERSMSDINSKYLLLLFFDLDCSHCKVVLRQLQELFNQTNRDLIEIYAVYTGSDSNKWRNFFLNKNNFDWINVSDFENKTHYKELYQVWMTPKIILFDDNRNIIGSRLSVDLVGRIINQKENKETIDIDKIVNAAKESNTENPEPGAKIVIGGGNDPNSLTRFTLTKSNNTKEITVSTNSENNSTTNSNYDFRSSVFAGIKMIELNKEEYEPFGIKINGSDIIYFEGNNKGSGSNINTMKFIFNDSISFYMSHIKNVSSFYNFSRVGMGYSKKYGSDNLRPGMISYSTKDNRFKLIKVVFEPDSLSSSMTKINDQYILNRINSLIPVVVRSKKFGLAAPEDIVFWFEPNDDFFNALPERIGKELKNEYDMIFKPGQLGGADINANKTCTFYEQCKNTFKEIDKISIFPNPSDGNFNISFDLLEKTSLKISLFSINGKELLTLTPFQEYEKGHCLKSFSLTDKYAEGLYLLIFQSKDGLDQNRETSFGLIAGLD